MSPFSQSQAESIAIGNDAGWALEFYHADPDGTITDRAASFRSMDYYATIEAHLQDGLAGGTYTITIEGLIDSDYRKISQAQQPRPVVAKLYMFWNDTISGPAAYLRNITSLTDGPSPADLQKALVAVLYVANVKRKAGTLTYDTQIDAVEWAFHMMDQPLQFPLSADFYRSVCLDIYDRTQVLINRFPEPDPATGRLTIDEPGQLSSEKVSYPQGKTYAAILTDIANAVQTSRKTYGHSMILIRDGQIFLGPRPFPQQKKDTTPLTVATGLLAAPADGASERDPTAPDISGKSQRRQFTLTLKGRPDIKPGDIVRFDPDPQDDSTTVPGLGSALAGAFARPLVPDAGTELSDNAITLAVTSVKHRLGKSAGFATEVKGVEVDLNNPWTTYSDTGASAKPKPSSPTADAGTAAASAIKEHVAGWTSNLSYVDVGQVRSFNSVTNGELSPSQTETVWEGLRDIDQNPNGTRRLPVDRNNAVRHDIPYASPFAWGKCGLVMPRYPGMRVALGHRRALDQDPIDLGAIWDSGSGPDSQPGDWWLSLPVGVDAAARAHAADSDSPTPFAGKVSQDLIDADGNRMIELGSLVVRIGRNHLQPAGTRPEHPGGADSITIEHADGGSAIVMKQDGSILIRGKSIEIDAGSGNVTIKASQVDIQ